MEKNFETKRCPYCGEEILAIAKKCKHCGEWLSEDKTQENDSFASSESEDTVIAEIENDKDLLLKNIPLSNAIIKWAFWAALIGLLIVTAHDLVQNFGLIDTSLGKSGKTRGIMALFNLLGTIPEWIGDVLENMGVVVLLILIKKAMSKLKKGFGKLFGWLIIANCVLAVFNILSDFTEDLEVVLSIVWLLFTIATSIIQLVLGIKLCNAYNDGRIEHLGFVMYITAGLELVVMFVVLIIGFISAGKVVIDWLFSIIVPVISFWYYRSLKYGAIDSIERCGK